MRQTQHGFTLLELLVVITVIVLLLALLAPALDKAIQASHLAVCSSNLHNMGVAVGMYTGDSKQFYPVLDSLHNLVGRVVSAAAEPRGRPLNPYVGYPAQGYGTEVHVARCPSDIGDAFQVGQNNTYKRSWGTSYLPAFTPNPNKNEPTGTSRVKFIFGYTGFQSSTPDGHGFSEHTTPTKPNKDSSLKRLDNKVITADWNWNYNRATLSEKTRCHRPDDPKRLINTLFGDGHVEFLDWRADLIVESEDLADVNKPRLTYPYNMSWTWW